MIKSNNLIPLILLNKISYTYNKYTFPDSEKNEMEILNIIVKFIKKEWNKLYLLKIIKNIPPYLCVINIKNKNILYDILVIIWLNYPTYIFNKLVKEIINNFHITHYTLDTLKKFLNNIEKNNYLYKKIVMNLKKIIIKKYNFSGNVVLKKMIYIKLI